MTRKFLTTLLIIFLIASLSVFYSVINKTPSPLVLMTDFGVKDGAVAAMKGVALKLAPNLTIHDLTHEIPAYNVWEGAYRLQQTAQYWPLGTVFVCVVDPGVGTERKSIILKTKANHYYVGPDNGLFTLVAESEGIEEIREISAANRLPNSQNSYTFFGRDVFAFAGAKLASKGISFDEVGVQIPNDKLIMLEYPKPKFENGIISAGIPILDIQYGNVWTNIDVKNIEKLNLKVGDRILVKIFNENNLVYEGDMPYVHTFGDVKEGEVLSYMNSLMNLSFGINMGDFSKKFGVGSGNNWKVELSKK
ncbi:S-adenosyl-l-methionine hydroxide adenosyltransferase family protein [Emticicia oligotrophica]|uniref:SAM hydrolase/SAM-dependent halogenase family protein n=1 Tax=Emticicia oligotrophica TaxID=312279 RepID=UPI00273C115D|nr:S-adenosyl-l-methionine hydroxide adenosyltransferase family protein [Emticicia oligotrophica]